MADVRALLKAKRHEARIAHPYAAYTSTGQLRCTVCAAPVKYASAWEGHLGSKAHRMAVMRAREAEKRRAEEEGRKKEESQAQAQGEAEDAMNGKRRAPEEGDDDENQDEGARTKRQKTVEVDNGDGGFPADFFSDPTRTLPLPSANDDDDDDDDDAPPPLPKTALDAEWESFQKTVLAPVPAAPSPAARRSAFERATVFAEPELAHNTHEGIPDPAPAAGHEGEQDPQETDPRAAAEAERRRKAQEERELIMDRLLEEERAQEEADARVGVLKGRLEMLKKRREGAREKKKKEAS